jgi:hypothetical protein
MGIAAAIGSAVIGGIGANKAAKAQKAAAAEDRQFQEETRDIIRGDLAPYRGQGTNALAAMTYMNGLGDAPMIGGTPLEIQTVEGQSNIPNFGSTGAPGYQPQGGQFGAMSALIGQGGKSPTTYKVGGQTFATMEEAQAYAQKNATGGRKYEWTQDPGYQFRLKSGNDSINALAGAKGGLMSGRTLQALSDYNQGMASQEFGNVYSRLGGMTDMGLAAAQMSGNASTNAAAGVSNALAARGNAQAAGTMGVANALQGGISNGLSIYQYQQNQPRTA